MVMVASYGLLTGTNKKLARFSFHINVSHLLCPVHDQKIVMPLFVN